MILQGEAMCLESLSPHSLHGPCQFQSVLIDRCQVDKKQKHALWQSHYLTVGSAMFSDDCMEPCFQTIAWDDPGMISLVIIG